MFDTTYFEQTHGHAPTGNGLWIFQNMVDGRSIMLDGVYSDVKTKLHSTLSNPSEWRVLP